MSECADAAFGVSSLMGSVQGPYRARYQTQAVILNTLVYSSDQPWLKISSYDDFITWYLHVDSVARVAADEKV